MAEDLGSITPLCLGAVCIYGIPQTGALPSQEQQHHRVTRLEMEAMEHSTEGLEEGHRYNWEAMRKEDKKIKMLHIYEFFLT